MKIMRDQCWTRRGVSLLWQAEALALAGAPGEAVPIRHFLDPAQPWRDELPSEAGQSLVIAGVEGCLDLLTPEDAAEWIEEDLKTAILDFQSVYESQVALILWLPGGRQRIRMDSAREEYQWLCGGASAGQTIAIGSCLFAGAQPDLLRIIHSTNPKADVDGSEWIGLSIPRIS